MPETNVTAPKRIQLRRTKGWRKPEGAISVARPTRWGNPVSIRNLYFINPQPVVLNGWKTYRWDSRTATAAEVVVEYRRLINDLDPSVPTIAEIRTELAGRDLACWCPLDQPCHADVLLELANP